MSETRFIQLEKGTELNLIENGHQILTGARGMQQYNVKDHVEKILLALSMEQENKLDLHLLFSFFLTFILTPVPEGTQSSDNPKQKLPSNYFYGQIKYFLLIQ